MRGQDLCAELIGRITFTDHFWLLVTGALPTPAQRAVLDATLVAIAEHGLVPSVQASRMTLAAAPEALQGAVAAGILGCGSVILGASEAAGRLLGRDRWRARAGAPTATRRRTPRCARVPGCEARRPGLRPSAAQGARSARRSACSRSPPRPALPARHIEAARRGGARCCRSSPAGRWR